MRILPYRRWPCTFCRRRFRTRDGRTWHHLFKHVLREEQGGH